VLAGPSWLAARLACESGEALVPRAGGNQAVIVNDLTVVGCPTLNRSGCAELVVHDPISGGWCYAGICCHPDVPPHRWTHLSAALDHGLNLNAALDLASIEM
jgi:hypothetical protein